MICKDCGQNVISIRTAQGNGITCDPYVVESASLVDETQLLVTRKGEVMRAGSGDFAGYYPHYSTCPKVTEKLAK